MTEGMLLAGRYELGPVIGRGGMAEVRRAVDTRLGRPVAIKRLRADLASDPTFLARFRREAQSAAGLNHPTIVAVYDTGEEVDPQTGVSVPFIVMELVEGRTLRDVLREGRKILPERAMEITQGVLDALAYSHHNGIIHRDIKPANVMLTQDNQVKVMDFGIARAVADAHGSMTQTAAVIGTAQYLSPEQARGESVDARSDIYSTGCLLYELLVGRPPFVGDSPVSVAYQHVREEPVPPSQLDAEITAPVDAVVLRALAKDPDDRYQDARAMRDDLARVLAGHPLTPASGDATRMMPPAATTPLPAAGATQQLPATRWHEAGERPAESTASQAAIATEEPPTKKRRAWPVVLLVLLGVVLAGGVVWGLSSLNKPAAPETVRVPTVTGSQHATARNQLTDAGFRVVEKAERGKDDGTVGTVTDQDPAGGAEAPKGATVTITWNQGPERVEVPSVVGDSRSDAQSKLKDAGFTNIRTETSSTSDTFPKVLNVSPNAGESVTKDTEIVLTVATTKVTVPDWVGSSRSDVQSQASQLGLKVSFSESESDETPGQVLQTSPRAGAEVSRDSTVDVVVAKKKRTPTPTPTPTPTDGASDKPTNPLCRAFPDAPDC